MRTPAHKLQHLEIQRLADDLIRDTDSCAVILTDWETGFVRDVSEHVRVRGEFSLTEKQLKRIHEIYDKYFEA